MFWNNKKIKDSKIDEGDLFRHITQDVVMAMLSMRVIKNPELKFFYDDKGLIDGLILQHTTHEKNLALKAQGDFVYMFACGMHAFGAGIYVSIYQSKVKKPVSKFDPEDQSAIALSFSNTDAYELALSAMGIDTESNNKKVFDQIIITAIKSAMDYAKYDVTRPEIVCQLMKVLYNAGITVVMR